MKNSLFLMLIFLVLPSLTIGQTIGFFEKAEVHYKSGKIVQGYVKFPFENTTIKKIKFRATKNSKTEKILCDSLYKLIFTFKNSTLELERIIAYNNPFKKTKISDPFWIAVISRGYTTLYSVRIVDGAAFTYYYCQRPDEKAASLVSITASLNSNATFKRNASFYFKDYPELSKKISNKTYTYEDLEKVVSLYNKWKEEQ